VSTDRDRRLAELVHEAAEIHHTVYRITDGDDPDWASWYAAWLLDLSELPASVGRLRGRRRGRQRRHSY
jgi:hypothetical protein